VFDSAQQLLSRYFKQKDLEAKFALQSVSAVTSDPNSIINNFEEFGNPLVYWVSTTLKDEGIGSFYVPSVQLRSDTESVNGIALRAACIQGSCIVPQLFSLVDKVCMAEDTKQICNNVTASVGNEKLLGLYFKLANLGTHNQPAANFTLVLSNKQKLVRLYSVTFGETVFEDLVKTVVRLSAVEAGTYDTAEVATQGRLESSRLRTELRERHEAVYF
jgi:hypothetical protein